jgi:hypothetical protein
MDRNHCQFTSRRILLVTCLFLTGCAEQSIPKLETAFDALEDARQSGAEDYAIEIFHEAESTYFQAQEELDQQQERLEPFRDYESATAMLASVLSSAAQAKLEAIANKEEAKANAHMALVSARRNLHTIRTWLTEFTVPATDHVAVHQLALAVQAAESLLAETESVMTEENFIGVMTTAHSLESLATRIQELVNSVRSHAAKREV